MKRTHGFTVIEIIVVILFLSVATSVLLIQKNNLAATHRDDQRKTAINAIYYTLEEVHFAEHGSYPSQITSKTLPALDPALLTDPNGITIGETGADYHYEGSNCDNTTCQSYTLRAELEKEADFIKTDASD
ncbi:MAG TPA: type II secretion system protein [Candidatus Saccharimonadales bacterium]|nr:type II secretion system protein [Candidatus Saccharimonadales bacterium]